MRHMPALFVLFVGLAGCGGGTQSAVAPVPTASLPTIPTMAITFDQAAVIAEKSGRPTFLQVYAPQPPPVWLATVYGPDGTLTDLRISTTDGTVTGRQPESAEEAKKAAAHLAGDKVGLRKAADAAAKAVPGNKVTAADLDEEAGRTVWEIETAGADRLITEVTVDAATGAVVPEKEN